MILKILKKLIWKIRYKRFCKLNGYNCPDCIYHDFMWEGIVFRGNRCRFPNYVEPPKGESMKQNNEVCIKKKDVVPDVGSVVRCNECVYSRAADPNGLYCTHKEIGKYRPVKNDFFCAYGESGLMVDTKPESPEKIKAAGEPAAEAIERIGSLSAAAVEPKRKTGVWIRCGEPGSDRNIRFECSVCHAGDVHAEGMNVSYCWKCGSEMQGETRGEEE